MMQLIKKFAYPVLFGAAIFLAGCSDDDDGHRGLVPPPNAVVLRVDNAESTFASAFKYKKQLEAFDSVPGTLSVSEITALTKQLRQNSSATPQIAIAETFTLGCLVSGTFTDTFTDTDHADGSFTTSGSISYSDCVVDVAILNGDLTYSYTLDPSTGEYIDTASGTFTMSDSETGATISLNDLDFAESGNEFDQTYTTTKFTLVFDFTIEGTSALGFLIELTSPIVESSGDGDGCPESGSVKITGANGSYAELTYLGNGMTSLTANGTPVAGYDGQMCPA